MHGGGCRPGSIPNAQSSLKTIDPGLRIEARGPYWIAGSMFVALAKFATFGQHKYRPTCLAWPYLACRFIHCTMAWVKVFAGIEHD